jgi:hypothetical protein
VLFSVSQILWELRVQSSFLPHPLLPQELRHTNSARSLALADQDLSEGDRRTNNQVWSIFVRYHRRTNHQFLVLLLFYSFFREPLFGEIKWVFLFFSFGWELGTGNSGAGVFFCQNDPIIGSRFYGVEWARP